MVPDTFLRSFSVPAAWSAVTADLLGLDASLRPIGRPQKLVET